MAIPPEPISQLLPSAVWVVEAEVLELLAEGPAPAKRVAPVGHTGVGQTSAAQGARLRVSRVLRGPSKVAELVVDKPEAAYLLKVGTRGVFLLSGGTPPAVLGRYGPDTYPLTSVEQALAER